MIKTLTDYLIILLTILSKPNGTKGQYDQLEDTLTKIDHERKNATAPPNVAEQIVHDAIDVAIERICKVFFCGGKYMPGQDERLDLWKLLEQFCKCENHEKLDYDMPIGSQAKEPEPVKKKSGPKM